MDMNRTLLAVITMTSLGVGCGGGPATDLALSVDESTRHIQCENVAVSTRRGGWADWTTSPVLVAAVDPLPQAASGLESEPQAEGNYCLPREGEVASIELQVDLGVVLEPGYYDESSGAFRMFVYGRDRAQDPWGDEPVYVEGFNSYEEGGLQVDKLDSDEGGHILLTITSVGGLFMATEGEDVPLDGAELRAQLFEVDDRVDLSEL